MYHNFNSSNSKLDRVMTNDQFDQIVEAILSGKYSWACLLILRFSGYNPLHYIPYRTYNRLMKANREQSKSVKDTVTAQRSQRSPEVARSHRQPSKLQDLGYVEELDRQSEKIEGGNRVFSLSAMSDFILDKFSNS